RSHNHQPSCRPAGGYPVPRDHSGSAVTVATNQVRWLGSLPGTAGSRGTARLALAQPSVSQARSALAWMAKKVAVVVRCPFWGSAIRALPAHPQQLLPAALAATGTRHTVRGQLSGTATAVRPASPLSVLVQWGLRRH